MAVFAKRFC